MPRLGVRRGGGRGKGWGKRASQWGSALPHPSTVSPRPPPLMTIHQLSLPSSSSNGPGAKVGITYSPPYFLRAPHRWRHTKKHPLLIILNGSYFTNEPAPGLISRINILRGKHKSIRQSHASLSVATRVLHKEYLIIKLRNYHFLMIWLLLFYNCQNKLNTPCMNIPYSVHVPHSLYNHN